MELSLGFSTCPNDTFIFDALVNGRIDTEGLRFKYHLADVEELNRQALNTETDITKISYHAYAYIADNYLMLNSGSALGYKNAPLLIAKKRFAPEEINNLRIAIPGKYTTANLLFSIAWPDAKNKAEYIFSDIEDSILNGETDAGLIIHESRFTYSEKGLIKIADLGEFWDGLTAMPIPLGGIAIRRDIPVDLASAVDRLIRKSVEYAMNNPAAPDNFVRKHAVSMDKVVMQNHINLYVNEFTRDLGSEGRRAVELLLKESFNKGVIPSTPAQIFV